MSTISKSFLAFAVVGALAGLIAFFNVSPFHDAVVQLASSSAGATFSNAKLGETVWTPSTAAAASSTQTLLNTDSSDRIIEDVFYSCSSVGSLTQSYSEWRVQAATSSGSTGIGSNTNYVLNTSIATSSALVYNSTTTPGLTTSPYVRVWAAGTYLNFQSNGTGPATCLIGVHYFAS